jgi:ABC-type bacteriocin/lantibiotic exporter with double-glycine peptidase domain
LIYVEGLNAASARLIKACQRFAVMVPHLQQLRALLAREPIARSSEPASSLAAPDDDLAIELEDVWFRYAPGGPWILRGYSLRVRRGELLRISGASGQGKTTVLRLIAGLIEPERGSVRVFGVPPRRARALLSYLPQDAHLLEGSIATNLTLMSGAPPEALAAALRATGLDGWLASLPMGKQTVLPPGGRTLSGGQRQWIALTAAVASQRPIALLDEATAHLDRARREQLRLERLFAGRTVVMVSHES